MASAPSNLAAPLTTQTEIKMRKRTVSSRLMDKNLGGAESNAVTKCLKQLANAAHAVSAKHQQRQSSVVNVEDEESTTFNSSPKSLDTTDSDGNDDEQQQARIIYSHQMCV